MTHQKCGFWKGQDIAMMSVCSQFTGTFENIKADLSHEIFIHCARAILQLQSCFAPTHSLATFARMTAGF